MKKVKDGYNGIESCMKDSMYEHRTIEMKELLTNEHATQSKINLNSSSTRSPLVLLVLPVHLQLLADRSGL